MKRWALLAAAALGASAVAGVLTEAVTGSTNELQAKVEHPPSFQRLLDEVPTYPDAVFFPMGDELRAGGRSREMGYALTEDDVDNVADRYEAIWRSRGHRVERRGGVEQGEALVIATDPKDPVVRTVVITERGEGGSTIIASVSDKLVARSPEVPVPEPCTTVMANGARDGTRYGGYGTERRDLGGGVDTDVLMLTCEGTLDQVLAFYDARLGDLERTELVPPTIDHKDAHVVYAGAGRHVILVATQNDERPPATAVSLTWQEQR